MQVWRPSWQSIVVSVLLCGVILWGAWFVGVDNAATPATPWPTVGRIAQLQGESGTAVWTVADASQYELILGGDTVIGKGVTVTGNTFVTESITEHSLVGHEQPRLRVRSKKRSEINRNGQG